ncbi:MAG: D-alanyl-D-alanine carboxypeptidase family protein [Huintestinicola sp.]
MKDLKIPAALLTALALAACAAVEEYPEETDAIPVLGDNIISSEPIAAETAPSDTETVSEASETVSETVKPAETWADSEEPPIELPVHTEEETEEAHSEEITAIELTYYEITLETGESSMPIVTMYPDNAPDKSEIWTSSDESVAEVDDIGNITAISEGECIIKVQSAVTPDVYAEVNVTVTADSEPEEREETAQTEPADSDTQPTYISGILIANKTYALPPDYAPGVDPDAQAAFDKMQSAAAAEGLNIYISSGYRSYDYQAGLYERYVERSGKSEADRYSARPGHSEHQTGLAFDLNTIDITFADTAEYDWLKVHCAEYGFIIRYPENGESVTGYMYEPWHIRYLGKGTAQKVCDSGLTLEEYLGIDSKYSE